MSEKILPDMSTHEPYRNHDRPFKNYAQHDPEVQEYFQHPDTSLHIGLDPPDMDISTKFIKKQREEQGHPQTRPAVDTSHRTYTPRDVARSCPSV